MGKVFTDQSLSLDGFSAGPNVRIDNAMGDGGRDDPTFHLPGFVVTHRPKATLTRRGGTPYTFVTDGIEGALARARATLLGNRALDDEPDDEEQKQVDHGDREPTPRPSAPECRAPA